MGGKGIPFHLLQGLLSQKTLGGSLKSPQRLGGPRSPSTLLAASSQSMRYLSTRRHRRDSNRIDGWGGGLQKLAPTVRSSSISAGWLAVWLTHSAHHSPAHREGGYLPGQSGCHVYSGSVSRSRWAWPAIPLLSTALGRGARRARSPCCDAPQVLSRRITPPRILRGTSLGEGSGLRGRPAR
jgi:hypothetical protein